MSSFTLVLNPKKNYYENIYNRYRAVSDRISRFGAKSSSNTSKPWIRQHGCLSDKNGNKIYASTANDKFQFTDLYGNPQGNQQGISLNFKFPELNGTLYYGFINYNDSKYPQPVYFKRYSKIDSGKAYINIRKNLSGKYDMVGWEKRGFGTLGYRIIRSDGQMLYDGKISFAFDGAKFLPLPTLVEGPFVDMVDQSSAVISFETTKPVQAGVIVDKKHSVKKNPQGIMKSKYRASFLLPVTNTQ